METRNTKNKVNLPDEESYMIGSRLPGNKKARASSANKVEKPESDV